jgi:molybdopterin/thiamine biosynthesis adenylyltransferase
MTLPEATTPLTSSAVVAAGDSGWCYDEAFSRQRGLIDSIEQQRLRKSRVAIVGMGGVGGVHLTTLARLGIGTFHIADPDCFEVANFNRQYGATTDSLGRGKAEVMAERVRAINPEVQLRVFAEAITAENVAEFLDGVDVLVDGIDFFAIEARRVVFAEARRRGIWAVTAGPVGFSTAWLVFSPTGMSFDTYFDLHEGMERLDQLVAFAVGLTPRATHLRYLDLSQVDPGSGRGPSAGLACQLCSGVAAAEVVKILLGRSPIYPAPHYCQFDAYRQVFRKGRLRWGNRHPLQRLKRWWLRRRMQRLLGTRTLPVPGGLPEPEMASATV